MIFHIRLIGVKIKRIINVICNMKSIFTNFQDHTVTVYIQGRFIFKY